MVSTEPPDSSSALLCAQEADPLWPTPGSFAHPIPASGYVQPVGGTGQSEACGRKRSRNTAPSPQPPHGQLSFRTSVFTSGLSRMALVLTRAGTHGPLLVLPAHGVMMASHHCWSRCPHPACSLRCPQLLNWSLR